MRFCSSKKGFTLIELLIVVAIIAILAAIAIPNFLEAQTRSKVSRVKSDQRSSSIALESFHIDHNWYPPDGFWLMNAWGQGPGAMPWVDVNCLPWFAPATIQQVDVAIKRGSPNFWRFDNSMFLTTPVAYMNSIPNDPFIEKLTWWAGSFLYTNWYDRWKYGLTKNPNEQPVTLDGISNGYTAIDGKRTFRWCLGSLGPDCIANDHMSPPIPSFMQYDPSNGTISKGDIFRVGP